MCGFIGVAPRGEERKNFHSHDGKRACVTHRCDRHSVAFLAFSWFPSDSSLMFPNYHPHPLIPPSQVDPTLVTRSIFTLVAKIAPVRTSVDTSCNIGGWNVWLQLPAHYFWCLCCWIPLPACGPKESPAPLKSILNCLSSLVMLVLLPLPLLFFLFYLPFEGFFFSRTPLSFGDPHVL